MTEGRQTRANMSISRTQRDRGQCVNKLARFCLSLCGRVAPSASNRLVCVEGLALIAFALLLAATIQSADGASLTAVGKHRSSRDRGCYYMLQHYKNGEQIKTDEPCLNCTCENSMLMCYLRVCPYVKPVGDKCIIERVPGECCPRITCADLGPPADTFEQDTTDPEPELAAASTRPALGFASGSSSSSSTPPSPPAAPATLTGSSTSLFDVTFTNATNANANDGAGAGCMLNNNYYPEGAQMPSADGSKSCEVCYCIRNSAACVMQDCALEVSGCSPIYAPGACCPTRYNCSAHNAFTTPRPKTLAANSNQVTQKRRKFWDLSAGRFTTLAYEGITSLAEPASESPARPVALPDFGRGPAAGSSPGPGCRAPNSTRLFADGERVPSRNKCEHCYCMRGELVCAVQECRPPCDGCVPIIDSDDQCCPKRYECAAPTQRVPTDNLLIADQQQESVAATARLANEDELANVTSTPTSTPTPAPTSTDASAGEPIPVSSSGAPQAESAANLDAALESGRNGKEEETSVMTTRQTKPPLRPISPKLSTVTDEEAAGEVAPESREPTSKAVKAPGPTQANTVDGFNLNGGEREQEASEPAKSAATRAEAPETPNANQQDPGELLPSSSAAPATMASGHEPASSPAPADLSAPQKSVLVTDNNMPANSLPASGQNLVNSDRKARPLVVPSQIPGEGSCRYKGKLYQNGEEVKSKQNCTELCMCINSVVYCDEVDCPRAPENADKCQKIAVEGECCAKYVCPEEPASTTNASSSATTTTMPPLDETKSETTTSEPGAASASGSSSVATSAPETTTTTTTTEQAKANVVPSTQAPEISSEEPSKAPEEAGPTSSASPIAPEISSEPRAQDPSDSNGTLNSSSGQSSPAPEATTLPPPSTTSSSTPSIASDDQSSPASTMTAESFSSAAPPAAPSQEQASTASRPVDEFTMNVASSAPEASSNAVPDEEGSRQKAASEKPSDIGAVGIQSSTTSASVDRAETEASPTSSPDLVRDDLNVAQNRPNQTNAGSRVEDSAPSAPGIIATVMDFISSTIAPPQADSVTQTGQESDRAAVLTHASSAQPPSSTEAPMSTSSETPATQSTAASAPSFETVKSTNEEPPATTSGSADSVAPERKIETSSTPESLTTSAPAVSQDSASKASSEPAGGITTSQTDPAQTSNPEIQNETTTPTAAVRETSSSPAAAQPVPISSASPDDLIPGEPRNNVQSQHVPGNNVIETSANSGAEQAAQTSTTTTLAPIESSTPSLESLTSASTQAPSSEQPAPPETPVSKLPDAIDQTESSSEKSADSPSAGFNVVETRDTAAPAILSPSSTAPNTDDSTSPSTSAPSMTETSTPTDAAPKESDSARSDAATTTAPLENETPTVPDSPASSSKADEIQPSNVSKVADDRADFISAATPTTPLTINEPATAATRQEEPVQASEQSVSSSSPSPSPNPETTTSPTSTVALAKSETQSSTMDAAKPESTSPTSAESAMQNVDTESRKEEEPTSESPAINLVENSNANAPTESLTSAPSPAESSTGRPNAADSVEGSNNQIVPLEMVTEAPSAPQDHKSPAPSTPAEARPDDSDQIDFQKSSTSAPNADSGAGSEAVTTTTSASANKSEPDNRPQEAAASPGPDSSNNQASSRADEQSTTFAPPQAPMVHATVQPETSTSNSVGGQFDSDKKAASESPVTLAPSSEPPSTPTSTTTSLPTVSDGSGTTNETSSIANAESLVPNSSAPTQDPSSSVNNGQTSIDSASPTDSSKILPSDTNDATSSSPAATIAQSEPTQYPATRSSIGSVTSSSSPSAESVSADARSEQPQPSDAAPSSPSEPVAVTDTTATPEWSTSASGSSNRNTTLEPIGETSSTSNEKGPDVAGADVLPTSTPSSALSETRASEAATTQAAAPEASNEIRSSDAPVSAQEAAQNPPGATSGDPERQDSLLKNELSPNEKSTTAVDASDNLAASATTLAPDAASEARDAGPSSHVSAESSSAPSAGGHANPTTQASPNGPVDSVSRESPDDSQSSGAPVNNEADNSTTRSSVSANPTEEMSEVSTAMAPTEVSSAAPEMPTSKAVNSTELTESSSEKPAEPPVVNLVETKNTDTPTSSTIQPDSSALPATTQAAPSNAEAEAEAATTTGSREEKEKGDSTSMAPILTESRVEEPKMSDVAESFSKEPTESNSTTISASQPPAETTPVESMAPSSQQSATSDAPITTTLAPLETSSATSSPTTVESASASSQANFSTAASVGRESVENVKTDLPTSEPEKISPKPWESSVNNLIETSMTPAEESRQSGLIEKVVASSTQTPDHPATSTPDLAAPPAPAATTMQQTSESSPAVSSIETTQDSSTTFSAPAAFDSTTLASIEKTPETVSSVLQSDRAPSAPESNAAEQKMNEPKTMEESSIPMSTESGRESSSTQAAPLDQESPASPVMTETRAEEPKLSEPPRSFTGDTSLAQDAIGATAEPRAQNKSESSLEMDSSSSSALPVSPADSRIAGEPSTAEPASETVSTTTTTTASVQPSTPEATLAAEHPGKSADSEASLSSEQPAATTTTTTTSSTSETTLPPTSTAQDGATSSVSESTSAPVVPERVPAESLNSSQPASTGEPSPSTRAETGTVADLTPTTAPPVAEKTSEPQSEQTLAAKPAESELVSSSPAPVAATNVTMSPADDFINGMSTLKSAEFTPVNLTTIIPSIRGVASAVTIPWSDISSSNATTTTTTTTPETTTTTTTTSSSSTTTTSAPQTVAYDLGTNGTQETQSSSVPPSVSSTSAVTEPDYEEVTDEPGCEYEGKTYSSAQQISRAHPCDFCFCFRGDIICLQQTCPPPVPHCFETVIDGFCCPRYECPVHTVRSSPNSSGLTLTPYETHSRLHAHTHEPAASNSTSKAASNVRGCFVDNKLIPVGKVIESASGPCLQCLCDRSGMMKCNPKECTPEDPLLQQINREVLQSTLSRSQRRR